MAIEKLDNNLSPTKLKEDNRLIRMKISEYLNLIRKDLRKFESDYRQEYLPSPTREKPFPDKKAVAFLGVVKKIELRIENLETLIRGADSSLDDKNWTRYKDKNEVLTHLCALDENMMKEVTYFYNELEQETIQTSNMLKLETFLSDFEQLLKKRQEYLRVQVTVKDINF